jgi:chemotaxis response regulator CheB
MIKVLVTGDRPFVIQGIKQILAETPDIVPVLEDCTDDDAEGKIWTHPDLDAVVLALEDTGPKTTQRLEGLSQIRVRLPVVVVSDAQLDHELWRQPFSWLTTNSPSEALVSSIRDAVHPATSSEENDCRETVTKLAGLSVKERSVVHEEA